jgi:hypothetical protein
MRRALFAVAFVAAAIGAGCFVVTGSSDGYSSLPLQGGAACTSAADCADAGGGVCCAGPGPTRNGIPTVLLTCQPSCPVATIQICAGNTECNDGGAACVIQSCTFSAAGASSAVPFQACGLINCGAIGGR